jgi:hypothetical protein
MEDCIAVIGAMDEEIAALSEGLDRLPPKGSSGLDLPIFKGRLHGQTIVVSMLSTTFIQRSSSTAEWLVV